MSKGIKMRSAKDRNGHAYTAETLQRMHDDGVSIPDLFCDHSACGCAVRFVPRYQQNRANRIEPVDVPAYIGLVKDSEHAAGCRYDAKGQLTAIAAQSDPDFLKSLNDGKRELRLLALHNGLSRRTLSGQLATGPNGKTVPSHAGNTTTEIVPSDEKLDSYLRTTADLVALRAACESDALLAAEVMLRLGTKRIPWKDFFFERERFDEAWEQIRAGGANSHPIALAGKVKNHYQPPAGPKARNSFLNCHALYRNTDTPDRLEVFEVSIAHPDGQWLTGLPVASEVLMFGIWKAADVEEKRAPARSDPSRIITYVTHKLILSPKFKRQVIKSN
jgi:hypothetical protein